MQADRGAPVDGAVDLRRIHLVALADDELLVYAGEGAHGPSVNSEEFGEDEDMDMVPQPLINRGRSGEVLNGKAKKAHAGGFADVDD